MSAALSERQNAVTPVYAEEAVLGGLLLANDRLHDVATVLSAAQFTSPQRARVYAAIRDRVLAGEAADAVTVGELLPDDFAYAIQLAASAISASNVPTYAGIVRENWRKREAVQIGARLMAAARSAEEGAIDSAIGALMALNATVTECEFTGKQALQMAWTAAEAAYNNGGALPGIPTGLNALDEILGGWHSSDLTIIGARPAMGKTALMGSLAEAAAIAGKYPGIISAEQPVVQLGLRRLSAETGVGAAHIRAGRIGDEDWSALTAGIARAKNREMQIYDRSAVTLDELVGIARKWKQAHGMGILFIDYAQRITVPGADRITEVSQVARGLKNLARDLQVPVVSLAQVKASVDGREDKRPKAGDLANSDELCREADQVITLYRPSVHDKGAPCGKAELWIEKNRHGPTGVRYVAFIEKTMKFADLARED